MKALSTFLLTVFVYILSMSPLSSQAIVHKTEGEKQAITVEVDMKPTQVSRYFFVRHAEKEKDGSKDPHLTSEGRQRAVRIASMLNAYRIDAVYSTDFHRTLETSRPTADAHNITITLYNPRTVKVLELLDKHIGENILVVGHSNTIPRYINTILNKDVYEDIDESDYGNMFIITIKNGEVSDVLLRNL